MRGLLHVIAGSAVLMIGTGLLLIAAVIVAGYRPQLWPDLVGIIAAGVASGLILGLRLGRPR